MFYGYRYARYTPHFHSIYLAQQRELLVIFFYIWYLIDFGIKYLKYKDKYRAYRNIIFEREAYENDNNLDYLKTRKIYLR